MNMKPKLMFLALIFLICSWFPPPGFTQEQKKTDSEKKETDKQEILHPHEEVVVTATMTRKAVKEIAASVNIIKPGDIESIPASNALNLLTFSPGIFVTKTGDFGRADVQIRGLGERGRKIAVLTDGRPEKMSLFGCLVTHTFPLDNVERIEVVRGPASVLYGSEALGGVVNIMTHMPSRNFEIDLSSSYGSFNTQQFTLKHGGVLGKFSYFLTADRRLSDGHRENSGYSGTSFTGKVQYIMSDHFVTSFQAKYFSGKKFEAGPVNFPLSDFWNDFERGALDFNLSGNWGSDAFSFKLYRNFGHHQFSDGWHSRDSIFGGILRYTTQRIANNELIIGGDFRFLLGKSYSFPVGDWDKDEVAFFIHDHIVLRDRLILSAGFRLHRDSIYGLEFCPQMGVVFLVSDKSSLKGSISKGFRSPQLNELYMYPPANPNLEPERLWSYEVGFEQGFADKLTVEMTFFLMNGTNLVEQRSNAAPPPLFLFQNTGTYTFRGTEISIRADLLPSLTGQIFYSYLDPGENTRGRPGHKLDFLLRFSRGRFGVSLNSQYVGNYFAGDLSTQPIPDYFLMSTRLKFNVSPAVHLFLDINNVLNEDYLIFVELPGIASGVYPQPGRNFLAGIRIAK